MSLGFITYTVNYNDADCSEAGLCSNEQQWDDIWFYIVCNKMICTQYLMVVIFLNQLPESG